jgi:hypothetical protein
MDQSTDTRVLQLPQKPVFVDWRGARRRLIVAGGVAVAVALGAWLSLIVVSVAMAMAGDVPVPVSG